MNQAEFEHIAQRLWRKAVTTAAAYSISSIEAEDIAQEAMLKLWTLHTELDNSMHAEKLTVCIARNKAIDCIRLRHTIKLDEAKPVIDEKQPTPESRLEDSENMAWLEERLKRLPSTEYKILKLRQVERNTNDEIANMLGIKKSSVNTLLARARAKMLDEIRKRMK